MAVERFEIGVGGRSCPSSDFSPARLPGLSRIPFLRKAVRTKHQRRRVTMAAISSLSIRHVSKRVGSSLARSAIVRYSSSSASFSSLFNPSDEHKSLREMLKNFVQNEVEPQALEYNKTETFNVDLFRKLGDLGILGLTVDEKYGGTAFDATSVALVHEELSYADPAFCFSYLAHSLLFVNNLHINGSNEQKLRFLPGACDGSKIGGMGMSEPNAGTDVLGMKSNASFDEAAGGWILNGTKVCMTYSMNDGALILRLLQLKVMVPIGTQYERTHIRRLPIQSQ